MTNSRLGISTITPTRTLDVNGAVSFNNEFFLFTDSFLSVGDEAEPTTTISGLLPGVTTINASVTNPADGDAQGTILANRRSQSALTKGQLIYFNSATGQWALADADALVTTTELLGICLNTVGATNQEIAVLIDGLVVTQFATSVADGDPIYVSSTAGSVTGVVPTAAGTNIRGVGHVQFVNGALITIHFHPDVTYFTNG